MLVRKSFLSIKTVLLLFFTSSINAECRNTTNLLIDFQTTSSNLVEMMPSFHKDSIEYEMIATINITLGTSLNNLAMTATLATLQGEMKHPDDAEKFTKLIDLSASIATKGLSANNDLLNRFLPHLSNSAVLKEVYAARERIQELSRTLKEFCGFS